jgi:hypothetical protein
MRELFEHEKQAVRELLRNSDDNSVLPQRVIDLFIPNHTQIGARIEINVPFTMTFGAQRSGTTMRRIGSSLCVPKAFGAMLFLVRYEPSGRLAYLECTPDSRPDTRTCVPYIRIILDCLRNHGTDNEERTMAEDLSQLTTSELVRRNYKTLLLGHMRLWNLGDYICYYLGQSSNLLASSARPLRKHTDRNSTFQVIVSEQGEVAVEGWIRSSK